MIGKGKIHQVGKRTAPKFVLELQDRTRRDLPMETPGLRDLLPIDAWKPAYYEIRGDQVLRVSAKEIAAPPPSRGAGGAAPRAGTREKGDGSDSRPDAAAGMAALRGELPARRFDTRPRPFRNPYNFVPFARHLNEGTTASDFGFHEPPGHHLWKPNLWHGWIDVRMTLATPLMLVETERIPKEMREHKTFDVLQRNGRPWIPPTSIKGALRSAYEAITGSRFPRFDGHSDRLGYRPSMIPGNRRIPERTTHDASPADLLPLTVRPAQTWNQFSSAERVFGWVSEGRPSGGAAATRAYRGHVRIGPVACVTDAKQAIERFPEPGLPLAILGAPKPQQARFYVGRGDGSAQDDGLTKRDAGYRKGKVLRGRKVYPHHRVPSEHWKDKDRGRAPGVGDPRRPVAEHRRAGDVRDTQNRSILGWVKPGTEFRFRVHVDNLSEGELGALVYLLDGTRAVSTAEAAADRSEPPMYLRLGGGKPLGFGSAILSIEESSCLREGTKVQEEYRSLDREPATTPLDLAGRLDAFEQACATAFGSRRPPHLLAYEQAARGFADGFPIHYPRATVAADPEGKNYAWFVANDRENQEGRIGLALDDLLGDRGLPILTPQRRGDGGSRGGGPPPGRR